MRFWTTFAAKKHFLTFPGGGEQVPLLLSMPADSRGSAATYFRCRG